MDSASDTWAVLLSSGGGHSFTPIAGGGGANAEKLLIFAINLHSDSF